jgi:DNA-directed RNA polymerase specialized sigma24 family protein
VFDLFKSDPPQQVTIAAAPPEIVVDTTLAVHIPEPTLGIDLAARAIEVRRVFFKGFARKVVAAGYDPNDVLQRVYEGILVRNKGKCPFDARKSSFAHYVHMVSGCIFSNYKRRYHRLERNEVFGVSTFDGEVLDVAAADLVIDEPVQEDYVAYHSLRTSLTQSVRWAAKREGLDPRLAEQCIQALVDGMRFKEIATLMEVPVSTVSQTVHLIRRVASEWRELETNPI